MGDIQLAEFEKEIKNKMDKAKNIAQSLESSSENDDLSLTKATSGVQLF